MSKKPTIIVHDSEKPQKSKPKSVKKPGRPMKYGSKKALHDAVTGYFDSISRTVEVKDEDGSLVTNDAGEIITETSYIIPPSIAAMCLYLGIDKSTWENYCDHELHPEFAAITGWAKLKMESYLYGELNTRTKGVTGIIFNLQNNYGMKQRVETEIGEDSRRMIESKVMSMDDKLALIREAAGAFMGEGALPEDGEEDEQ